MATDWTTFGAFAVVVTVALVALTRQSATMLADDGAPDRSSTELLANTTASQAVVGVLLVAVGWATGVPSSAVSPGVSVGALAVGAGAGLALAVGNEATMRALDAAGLSYDSSLRDALAPDSPAGWVLLLGVALPVVAGFEELLFRGVLVGAFAAGFGVDPWLLVAPSSVAFGASHTAQGFTGVVVASLLGVALCVIYLATGSLLAAVVAHYVVNAAEFAVHGR